MQQLSFHHISLTEVQLQFLKIGHFLSLTLFPRSGPEGLGVHFAMKVCDHQQECYGLMEVNIHRRKAEIERG